MSGRYTVTVNIDTLIDNVMHEDAEIDVCFDYNYEPPTREYPGDNSIDLIDVKFGDVDIWEKLTPYQYGKIVDKCYELIPSRNGAWDD